METSQSVNFNILIISDVDFPEGMAATAHITLMAKGIIKNSVNAMLLIPSSSFNGDTEKYDINEGIYEEIPYKFFNKHGIVNNKFTFNSYRNVKDIAKYIKKRKKNGFNDVVITYCNDFLKYHPIFLTCYSHKIPFFPWEVEKRISSSEAKSFRSKLQMLGFRLSDIILPKISTGFIVISTYLKQYYSNKMPQDKICVSPILVNSDDSLAVQLQENNKIKQFIDSNKNKFNLIVYSGSFGEKDGFPYILDAFKKLLLHHPKSILVTTGKPSKYNPIENILKIVNELGIIDNFKYLGLVNRNELKFINQNADLLLVCRSNSEFANHGFPWKLGEYLMTKKPIIATKVGDIENYLQDNKEIFLAESENAESIANKMINVFDDYDRAKQIANNGYLKALEVFDYVNESKKLIEFIKTNLKYP